MSSGSRWVVATGNRHKLAELAQMLGEAFPTATVSGLGGLADVPTIAETAPDFAGNATLKAQGIAQWLAARGEPGSTLVVADDSGLCVDALGGAPGVFSARFAGEPSDDGDNNRRLCAELEVRNVDASLAHYVCVLAVVRVDGEPLPGRPPQPVLTFAGRWDVEVRTQARGSGGFGYDPHAWLDGGRCTVAELSIEQKALRSHRGRALAELARWCREHLGPAAGSDPGPA